MSVTDGQIETYRPSNLLKRIDWFLLIGIILSIGGIVQETVLDTEIPVNLGGWGVLVLTSSIILWTAKRAQDQQMSDGLVMGLLSWGLFPPVTIFFQAITLVSFGNIEDIIFTGGGLELGPLTFAPWWFYFWAGLSVFITAWFMTESRWPRWPPRRFVVWPWVTAWFVAFFWPSRVTTNLLGIDIGDWTLETKWVEIFDPLFGDFFVTEFEFEAISFGEYWGAFFLFIWLLLAFTIWTVFVLARRLRVGKENYNNEDL